MIEIHGQVKEYDGRAEIILEEYRQLSGSTAKISPLPKNYVERKVATAQEPSATPKPGKRPQKSDKRQATNRYTRRLGLVCKCRADKSVPQTSARRPLDR